MSIDKLQNRIRKLKNPAMLLFLLDDAQVPPSYHTAESGPIGAYRYYAKALLSSLKNTVPAVRFDMNTFSAYGAEGLNTLADLLNTADSLGYYVLLDAPAIYTPRAAGLMSEAMSECWKYDGLLLTSYIGSDGVKPFAEKLPQSETDLFITMRTANKSASEIQDLLTGTRLVYTVVADMAKRLGEDVTARCSYSRIAGVGPATSAETLQQLRSKYPAMFLLVDGYDYSGANAKNCSMAFDKFGHGAVACAGDSVIAAWRESDDEPVAAAIEAAERMKKNLTRYVTIL